MFKRAIVASDFSRESMALVNTSGGLKGFGTAEILLLPFRKTPVPPAEKSAEMM